MRRRPARVGSDNVDAERLPVVIELSGEGVVANSPVPLVRFEQDEFSFVYGGSWLTATSVSRSGGDARFAASPGASFTATFTGDAFRWITTTGSNRGIAQVTIDGVDHGTVDTYTPRVGWQQPVFEAAGLGPRVDPKCTNIRNSLVQLRRRLGRCRSSQHEYGSFCLALP
jgi:hypothetical protein